MAWPEPFIDRRATASELASVLADWRAAERNLDGMAAGSLEWAEKVAEITVLRARHHRLFLEVSRPDDRG